MVIKWKVLSKTYRSITIEREDGGIVLYPLPDGKSWHHFAPGQMIEFIPAKETIEIVKVYPLKERRQTRHTA
ncbi:hypothetical protein HYS48_02290 [Candidatus Woesearchaeota archaeon]|nr:hypothetical protein [Candidatus Woesearchaeota archaeon]